MTIDTFLTGDSLIEIVGPSGGLQAVLHLPQDARRDVIGVVCHPHSLFGGTMQNKVVSTVVKACAELSLPSVRFNFRGVGQSAGVFDHGVGEADDLSAVIAWVRTSFPNAQLILAGFSFGSFVAYRVTSQVNPRLLISIAPPVKNFSFVSLPEPSCPWLVIQNEDDDVVAFADVQQFVSSTRHTPQFIINRDGGHFFHGKLVELRSTLMTFISQQLHMTERDR